MIGMGTLVNVAAVVVGGLIGMFCQRLLTTRLQQALTNANGLSVIFLGIAGTLAKMLTLVDGAFTTQGTVMLVISMALGCAVGEILDIDRQFQRFGVFLRNKTGNQGDGGFVNAFVTTSFAICIGAMAIVGSLQEGLTGDASILYTKALLDFIIVAVMSSTLGKGCLFAAIPVGLLQGGITALSGLLAPIISQPAALNNLSLVGNILIVCVGVNLLADKPRFKVANMLPALIVAVVWGLVQG